MEGITNGPYRLALHRAFPEWDLYATDFLRIPSSGFYSEKKLLKHFGEKAFTNSTIRKKTTFQVLTSERANTADTVDKIARLGFERLDLNLGCPSKRVNSHGGGAWLLSDLKVLEKIIRTIRRRFNYFFSVKIRVGYHDDRNFEDCLKMFEAEGVEAITVHARTRDQLYRGKADWKYIERAVKNVRLPIIGNGDIWTLKDIKNMFDQTGCHAIMLARGALKTPWMALWWKRYKNQLDTIEDEDLLHERRDLAELYLFTLENEYRKVSDNTHFILKRFKALANYLFDGSEMHHKFLRSQSLEEFFRLFKNFL